MELVHDFVVPVSPEQAWTVLTDVERIAPCLPGASVTSVDGDAFEGGMKIKVGPIGMTFKGHGCFVEKDATARTAVIEAKGRDARGNGGAQAHVTAALTDADGSTAVHVITDLNVSGKAAQFGTGVMKDISNRLLDQFVDEPRRPAERREPSAGRRGTRSQQRHRDERRRPPPLTTASTWAVCSSAPSPPAATAKTVATLIAGIAFGYLWGKNRVLERQARRG